MAKKGYRRHSGGMKIPLAVVLGFAPLAVNVARNTNQIGFEAIRDLTGYQIDSGKFNFSLTRRGLVPILLGFGVHKVVGGMLGINRMLGRMRIPLIRI